MNHRIYMDHHATTPVDPRVLSAMLPFFSERFGNAASGSHAFGWEAESAVEEARTRIAAGIGATPREIVFTSGATESNNLAIKGVIDARGVRGAHVICSAIEHPSVLDPLDHLETLGVRVTRLPVDSGGLIDPETVRAAITPETVLISVMTANNEIGAIQPIAEIGRIAHAHKVLFHTDAAQAMAHCPLNVESAQIDLLSMSAHKLYGPKGVGALYVRRHKPRVRLVSQIHGGGHEQGLRSGTLPVALIVGFGEAVRIAVSERSRETERVAALRDRLKTGILNALDGVTINGTMESRLPNNLNLSFAHVESESLLVQMGDVALSSGSACASVTETSSHVLAALGRSEEEAKSAVRFGLGRFNTALEVDYVIGRVTEAVQHLRARSPHHVLQNAPRTTDRSVGTGPGVARSNAGLNAVLRTDRS